VGQRLEGQATVRRDAHAIALGLEQQPDALDDILVVLDDQDVVAQERPPLAVGGSKGSSTVKVAPFPTSLSTPIVPPCASTMRRAM
jgi:hypothetical protein